MHVFTYGTLMYSEVWQAVAGRPAAAVQGKLAGFAIYRVRDQLFPGILSASPVDRATRSFNPGSAPAMRSGMVSHPSAFSIVRR